MRKKLIQVDKVVCNANYYTTVINHFFGEKCHKHFEFRKEFFSSLLIRNRKENQVLWILTGIFLFITTAFLHGTKVFIEETF